MIGRNRLGVGPRPRADAPTITPSTASVLQDLKLHRLFVVYRGKTRYALDKRIEVLPLEDCVAEVSSG